MSQTPQSSEPGTVQIVQTPEGVRFENIEKPASTGQAYVEPPKAKTKREIEMEAGRLRVEQAQHELRTRPPRIKSQQEIMAEGTSVPVFRPNSVYADRVTGNNGAGISQEIGALMRRVGSRATTPAATG
jgi:hypothetical protein